MSETEFYGSNSLAAARVNSDIGLMMLLVGEPRFQILYLNPLRTRETGPRGERGDGWVWVMKIFAFLKPNIYFS